MSYQIEAQLSNSLLDNAPNDATEYALRDAATPLGIADYTHKNALPAPEVLQQLLAPHHEKTIES